MSLSFVSALPLNLLSRGAAHLRPCCSRTSRRFGGSVVRSCMRGSSSSSDGNGIGDQVTNFASSSPSSSPSPSSIGNGTEMAAGTGTGKFELLSQDVIFKRYQTVYKREVRYPDGREISFDVLGNERSDFRSVFVFPFDRASATATLIREYSPGRNAEQLSLVAGMFESDKHASLEDAALAELKEEAHLTSGELIALNQNHPPTGFAADKYSLNSFYFFLALDCAPDPNPPPRDAEEWIHIEHAVPLHRVRQYVHNASFNVPHALCAMLALEKLAQLGFR